jgi:hypothetical protein
LIKWKGKGGTEVKFLCGKTLIEWKGRGCTEVKFLCGKTVIERKGRGHTEVKSLDSVCGLNGGLYHFFSRAYNLEK